MRKQSNCQSDETWHSEIFETEDGDGDDDRRRVSFLAAAREKEKVFHRDWRPFVRWEIPFRRLHIAAMAVNCEFSQEWKEDGQKEELIKLAPTTIQI